MLSRQRMHATVVVIDHGSRIPNKSRDGPKRRVFACPGYILYGTRGTTFFFFFSFDGMNFIDPRNDDAFQIQAGNSTIPTLSDSSPERRPRVAATELCATQSSRRHGGFVCCRCFCFSRLASTKEHQHLSVILIATKYIQIEPAPPLPPGETLKDVPAKDRQKLIRHITGLQKLSGHTYHIAQEHACAAQQQVESIQLNPFVIILLLFPCCVSKRRRQSSTRAT